MNLYNTQAKYIKNSIVTSKEEFIPYVEVVLSILRDNLNENIVKRINFKKLYDTLLKNFTEEPNRTLNTIRNIYTDAVFLCMDGECRGYIDRFIDKADTTLLPNEEQSIEIFTTTYLCIAGYLIPYDTENASMLFRDLRYWTNFDIHPKIIKTEELKCFRTFDIDQKAIQDLVDIGTEIDSSILTEKYVHSYLHLDDPGHRYTKLGRTAGIHELAVNILLSDLQVEDKIDSAKDFFLEATRSKMTSFALEYHIENWCIAALSLALIFGYSKESKECLKNIVVPNN